MGSTDEGHRLLYKVLPLYNIFWDIFDRILEEEPVPMAERRFCIALIETNLVDRVSKGELFRVSWDIA